MYANTDGNTTDDLGTALDPILREIIAISGNAFELDRELLALKNETDAQDGTLDRISRETGVNREAAERTAAIATSLSDAGVRAKTLTADGIEAQKAFEGEYVTIQSGMTDIAQFMETLENGAERIRELSALLEEFGNQLNILSINTSIEAARAGQAGRGFAVIAREMKGLHAKMGESASGVGSIIGSLRQGIKSVNGKITSTRGALETSRATVRRVSAGLDDLASLNERLVAETGEIVELSEAGIRNNRGIDELAREIDASNGTVLSGASRARDLAKRVHDAVDTTLRGFSGYDYPWHETARRALADLARGISSVANPSVPAGAFAAYPWMELIYVMDARGIQTSENVWNPATKHEKETGSAKGASRAGKDYFAKAMGAGGACVFSDIYLSSATNRLCSTVSMRVGEGSAAGVLAVDITLDGILSIGK